MDGNQIVKEFIRTAREFEKHKNKDSVLQSLQMLSTIDEFSVFDTGSFEAAEFYVILHDLLTHHSTESDIVWSVVSVLQAAVRNPNASSALVHTYHFIHPLTTLLEAELMSERKLILLRTIQELSYGVVIHWQEAHLPRLITLLVDIIKGNEMELISVALGVMVNLCHKNKPAVYTLTNCVDIKVFLKRILNIQRENVETSVQVCKLLMVLNHLSGNVPDAEILTFVRVSFLRINKAFSFGNVFLMRQIVDFFRDAKESEHGRKVLLIYKAYAEDTDNLLNALIAKEVPNNWQCVQQLIEFMNQLVDLDPPTIIPLYTKMTAGILPWIQVVGVAPSSLELLTKMLHNSRIKDEEVYKAVCTNVENHLQMFVEMLHNLCRNKSDSCECLIFLTSLLHSLRELAVNPNLSTVISDTVDKEELKNLLLPLMSLNSNNGSHLFQQPVTAVCVEVLSFVSELSMVNKDWLFLYSDLLQKKQILKALAVALYSGSYEVKKQILYLAGTTSFSKECLTVLSKHMADLNQLFLLAPASRSCTDSDVPFPHSQLDISPSFTKVQSEDLNTLIEKLDDLYNKNQVHNMPIAGVIEMYNYKLAEMRRAERSLQSNLANADSHRTQLSHRVALLSAETGRLHQLLYSDQQMLEGSQMELVELREKLHSAQSSASSSHIKFKQFKQDVQSKGMIIKEQRDDILKLKQILEENVKKCEELEKKTISLLEIKENQNQLIQNLEQKTFGLEEKAEELSRVIQKLEVEKSDLQTSYSKLEDKLGLREKSILEKEVLIEDKISKIQSLEKDLTNQQARIKNMEKTVKEKEKEISVQQDQLVELERMRKIIFEITGGKKNMFK